MKALSLYEPWATLVALEEKEYEIRGWKTDYRGPLVICAAKQRLSIYKYPPIKKVIDALWRHKITLNDLNWGRAVAIADLTVIYHADDLVGPFCRLLKKNEKIYGDFSPGRFAWKLERVRRFKNPFPVKGKQGLFDVDDSYKNLDTYEPI